MQYCRHVAFTLAVFTACASAQIPDFTPPTPLLGAIVRNDTKEIQRLVAAGADPNDGRFIGGATPLLVAVMHQNAVAVKTLLEKGADPKATDGAGSTTLMWAAANEAGEVGIVQDLLRRGVDPNVANKMGETALTWALRRGYTPIVDVLKKHGASDTQMVRQSVDKAIALLQKSGPEFVKVSGCTSCHNQSLPQMAFKIARQRGFAVEPATADKQAKSVVAMFKPYREQMLQGKENIPDPAISVSYSLLGLAAEGYAKDETTEAMAHLISRQQTEDGSFRVFAARPPIESSAITGTVLSLRSLQVYGKDPEQPVAKAREWLLTATPRTNEERAMRLMGLMWAGADPDALKAAARALLAQQRQDGGWGQLTALESDAYATGQALVALQMAGQVSTSDAAYQKGAAFLLRTQRPDGSWLVRSRSFPFQPYKESGFPHGKDQWISASGTSWAVMALALTTPVNEPVSSGLL